MLTFFSHLDTEKTMSFLLLDDNVQVSMELQLS